MLYYNIIGCTRSNIIQKIRSNSKDYKIMYSIIKIFFYILEDMFHEKIWF